MQWGFLAPLLVCWETLAPCPAPSLASPLELQSEGQKRWRKEARRAGGTSRVSRTADPAPRHPPPSPGRLLQQMAEQRWGQTAPRKAPGQLQGVSAEGLLPGPWREAPH